MHAPRIDDPWKPRKTGQDWTLAFLPCMRITQANSAPPHPSLGKVLRPQDQEDAILARARARAGISEKTKDGRLTSERE